MAAAMLLTAQGVPALAENAVVGNEAERIGETRELPENPAHHCAKKDDETDTTTWSYVYFGSYPQSEEREDALTTAISGTAYDADVDSSTMFVVADEGTRIKNGEETLCNKVESQKIKTGKEVLCQNSDL